MPVNGNHDAPRSKRIVGCSSPTALRNRTAHGGNSRIGRVARANPLLLALRCAARPWPQMQGSLPPQTWATPRLQMWICRPF